MERGFPQSETLKFDSVAVRRLRANADSPAHAVGENAA